MFLMMFTTLSMPPAPTGQPEGLPTGPQVQVPMNKAQGPNETVLQDPPMPQAATQVHKAHKQWSLL